MPPNEDSGQIRTPVRLIALTGAAVPVAQRAIPVERPVAIRYGGLPHAVMMASPDDLADFAYGFSLTEGVIDTAEEIRAVTITPSADGIDLAIELSGARLSRHLQRRRTLSGRTGCGVCGVETLGDLPQASPLPAGFAPVPAPSALRAGLAALETAQVLNHATRAVHAAGWCDAQGHLRVMREDVGRHNALDKLIGALLRQQIDPTGGFAIITSRCSFEMVEKAVRCRLPVLVAISAPTSLAVERAHRLGLTLLAVARPDAALLFTGPADLDGRMP